MGGSVSSISNAVKGLGIGTVGESLKEVLMGGDQRSAFNAILLATIAHNSKKTNFNLETEINDLNVRLGNLRSMNAANGIFGEMGTLFHQLDATMKTLIKN